MHTNMSGTTEGSTYPSDNNTQDTLTQNASSSNPQDTNSEKSKIYEGVLLGLGNPLLDMTITTDEAFLEKYDLKANDAIIAEKKHEAMFEEITERYKPMFVAGGATQNTMRVAQWLLGVPKSVTFVGCVGKDAMGSVLKETAENVGVGVHYQIHESKNTGKCGAIITGENRSLVTSLGAARSFTHNFINEHWELIERAKFFYIGGFVFPVSAESIKEVAEHACDTDKTLIMNLSAPFLCEYFADPDIGIMQYIDILFGNETEAAKFCGLQGIKADTIQEMALKTAALPKKNTGRERIVIFTQGRDPTIIATDGRITEHPICPIEKDLIKDTNGCGDAFVGGFLSQLVQGASLDECLRCGNYAARTVIQYFGCTYPSKPDFK
ncbi:unnamed protein product [Owenia fusiformis]|uniref:Adenosine kinase n=1 Tax=Owenia fusiformis TaxID=6347 RepID=A0A8J1TX93_OWEFU|nr:unnamed protein product [Owenia fusiformis]